MATQLNDLKVKITLDNSGFNKSVSEVQSSMSKISSTIKTVGTVITGAFAVKAVINFGKDCLNAASDAEEMRNKFDVVFKDSAKDVESWASSLGNSIGRSKYEIMGATSNIADLAQGMGVNADTATDLAQKYTSLAYDLASFNNVSDERAINALTSALTGETEACKALGINLTENVMNQSAYMTSIGKTVDQLSLAEKAEAYYQVALEQSQNALGDAERSSMSYENQQKRLAGVSNELRVAIGENLLPVFTPLVSAAASLVEHFTGMITAFGQARDEGQSMGDAFLTAIGPALDTLGISTEQAKLAWSLFTQSFQLCYDTFIAPVVELFKTIIQDLAVFFSENMTTIMSIFGTVGETLGSIYTSFIAPMWNAFMEIVGTVWTIINNNLTNIMNCVDVVFKAIQGFWESILKPVWDKVVEYVNKVWGVFEQYMPEIQRVVDEVFGMINTAWETALKPAFEAIGDFLQNILFPIFDTVFNNLILPVVETVFDTIISLWDNSLKPMFQGIVDFIGGVFTGDWSRVWDGVVGIFDGIFGGIVAIAKAPINLVIGFVNKLIGALNTIQIPDWVPLIGGKGINLPTIPKLWKGSNFTLGGPTLVGEQGPELVNMPRGASVLPAHKTRSVLKRAAQGATPTRQSANIYVELDGRTIAKATGQELVDIIRLKTGLTL